MAVVLPFHGEGHKARSAIARLDALRLRDADEVVLVDNTTQRTAQGSGAVRVVRSPVERSAYAARNFGAESTLAPWILFVDADCELSPGLLDAYFDPAPENRDGAVAGAVRGDPCQPGLVPRYVRSRRHLDQERQLAHSYRPMAVTANLLVRREAWEAVGGFAERTDSGADADFCFRIQDAGWKLAYNPRAEVLHEHRDSVRALLAQARRDGAAAPWLSRRHPGYPSRAPAGAYPRALAGAIGWPLLARPERGLFKALDGIWSAGFDAGALFGPQTPQEPPRQPVIVALDSFPEPGDPRVGALCELGALVHVEARRRPARADWLSARAVSVAYLEDDPLVRRATARRLARAGASAVLAEHSLATDLARLLARSPGATSIEALPADRDAAAARIRLLRRGA